MDKIINLGITFKWLKVLKRTVSNKMSGLKHYSSAMDKKPDDLIPAYNIVDCAHA